jgi:alginate O-acetyltransferase complex protein AlgJ
MSRLHLTCTLFLASEPLPSVTPLRLVVPAVAAAENMVLTAMRRCAPPGCSEKSIDLGHDAPGAELALLDYWTDLPAAERSRVWCAVGALAGALMRFDGRPAAGFALLASPALTAGRAPNPQARSLLVAEYPDTWTLALDAAPPLDAEHWRFRLAEVLRHRWCIGRLDDTAPLASLAAALQVDLRDGAEPVPAPSTSPVGGAREADWLDQELHARIWRGDADRVDALEGWGAPPEAPAAPLARPDEEEKVIRGKRGRLFLAHDSHDSHRQMIGARPLSGEELETWERGTAARMTYLQSRGCVLVHLIGPAPQVVHANDLPDQVEVSGNRPSQQLLKRLATMRPAPEVVYPLSDLLQVRGREDPFGKTDSHWNDLGAYIAYEAVLSQLGDRLRVRRVQRHEVSFQETCYLGDLGVKVRPQRAAAFLRARVERPRARLVADNRVRNHGRMAIYECEEAPPTRCVVFGDSWAYPMLLYLAESFRRLVFFHRVNVIDREAIERERPELVLVILTERFCTAVPNDAEAVPFERVVAAKTRALDLIPEVVPPMHRYQFLHSVKLERGLPHGVGFRLPPG